MPYSSDDKRDVLLVHRMAEGDAQALHELYAIYAKRLFAYAFRITGDSSQAEDILQDVLLSAWKSSSRFRGEGRVVAWLLGMVHHQAYKSFRHPVLSITEEFEESMVSSSPSPEELSENELQKSQVKACLESLSPEYREVLDLVFYQGLNLEETARVCSVPLGTVKSRLSYARRLLRGELTRRGLEE